MVAGVTMDGPSERAPADPAVGAIAALEDDLRGRVYVFIRCAGAPVTGEQTAAAAGISRKLATFHLNKLVEVGLLWATDAPASPIRKVGRRPKHYQPTDLDVRFSIPTRQRDELADILLHAILTQTDRESGRRVSGRAHPRTRTRRATVPRPTRPPRRWLCQSDLAPPGRRGFQPSSQRVGCDGCVS
jgi:predicted ArsR family transcriptional regulator